MAQKRRSPAWVWLVAAVLLLAGGAWLMRGAEPPPRDPPSPVKLPIGMSMQEQQRSSQRRTWTPLVIDAGNAPARPRDPILALMPTTAKHGVMVAEVSAILNSEFGSLLQQCFFEDSRFMQDLRDAGLDPTTTVDRVAVIDDAFVITGNFKNAGWRRYMPEDAITKDYGRHGLIVESTRADGGMEVGATWSDQMFIFGQSEESLKSILDRLEGNAPAEEHPVLDENDAYGDVYGVVTPSALSYVLGKSDPALGNLVEQSAKNVQLHMNVGHDVGMVASVAPNDPAKTDELRRALGSALSLARMKAVADGRPEEAELLDLARVGAAEKNGAFQLEAGLPHDFLEKALRDCIEMRAKSARNAKDLQPASP